MSDEWGPWIDHDGNGCPCRGKYVQCINDGRRGVWEGIAGSCGGQSWDWRNARYCRIVIRYRIRKPRALIQLIELVENLPERAKEDA